MILERRSFLAALLAAPLLAIDYPKRKAKVVKLFRSPDAHPNAMETTAEGLWIGEQTTDRAHLLDWKGNLIRTVETESSNTSGIAFGAGALWMAANGKAIGRPAKVTDATTGEVLKVDPAELAKWMQGQGVPPITVFLQALDIMSRPRNMSRSDDSGA